MNGDKERQTWRVSCDGKVIVCLGTPGVGHGVGGADSVRVLGPRLYPDGWVDVSVVLGVVIPRGLTRESRIVPDVGREVVTGVGRRQGKV